MKVKLIAYSADATLESAKLPYRTNPKSEVGLAKAVFDLGHRSIARHSVVAFLVEKISQDALRQISRHPHIVLTVTSSRYCSMAGAQPFIPEWVFQDVKLRSEFVLDYIDIMVKYNKWLATEKEHDKKDTAKLMLPLASTTDLIISGNLQAMYEFIQLRSCTRVQEEARGLALAMKEALLSSPDMTISSITASLGCRGDEYGVCPESKKESCGKYPVKGEAICR